MNSAYIIDALRTPVGRFKGALSSVRPDDMAAHTIEKLMERNSEIDPQQIEDVLMGDANQAGEDNRNVARMALLLAGLPKEVAGSTTNRLCASSLQTVMDASRALMVGDGDVYIAGGVESMSRAPLAVSKPETAYDRKQKMYDTTIGWRFVNPKLEKMFPPEAMGETAENIVEQWDISREEQDEFAYESQMKWKKAHEAGKFEDEIVPITVPRRKKEDLVVGTDEHPRPNTSLEKLAKLPAVFREGGTVTPGNASGVNDGAGCALLTNEDMVEKHDLDPMAKVIGMAVAGVEPRIMGIGPVPATRKALKRADLTMEDIDLIELNEAFAGQSIACMRELELDPEIVNVNGGAIAMGHPLGFSGIRISTTLLYEMQRRDDAQYGLATMCVGVGQGAAVIYEKV